MTPAYGPTMAASTDAGRPADGGPLTRRFPPTTWSAYCVWLLERAGASVGYGHDGGVSGGASVGDAVIGWGSGWCSRVS